jgi:hypothetical protein
MNITSLATSRNGTQKQKPVHRLGAFISGQFSTSIFFFKEYFVTNLFFWQKNLQIFLRDLFVEENVVTF